MPEVLETAIGLAVLIAFFSPAIYVLIRDWVERKRADRDFARFLRDNADEIAQIERDLKIPEKRERKRKHTAEPRPHRAGRRHQFATEKASKATEAKLKSSLLPSPAQAVLLAEWKKLLNRKDVLIVDTETTPRNALLPKEATEVMEVAVIDTIGELRFRSYAQTFLPLEYMSEFKASHVSKAPHWRDVHEQLYEVFGDARCVIAWNAGFDRSKLEQTSAKYDLITPRLPWRDALADYRKLRPGGHHSLVRALRREGVRDRVEGPLHWARYDCLAVLEVMRSVTRDRENEIVFVQRFPTPDLLLGTVTIHKSGMCISEPDDWQAVQSIDDVRTMFPIERLLKCAEPWCFGSSGRRPKSLSELG